MKIRFGLKTIVILVYLTLFTAGLVLIYQYQEYRRHELSKEISGLQLQEFMEQIVESDPIYSDSARALLCQLNEIKATIEIGNKQTAVYSGFYLVLMLVVSLTLFLWAIYTLTSPLQKFSVAAEEIASGNFDIQLKESGTWELREAQHSFNMMSTQLQNTQQKLLEAEKLNIWKQFSRMLAHEIKNPLTPIRLSLERLIEKKGSENFDKVLDRSLSIIWQEVENLQNLAMNFSNFAKEVPVYQQKFDLKQKLQSIIRSYEDRIEIRIYGNSYEVAFDEMHFYQIITNILQNGIDAAGTDQPLILELSEISNSLKIIDKGPGIEPEDLNKLFEPYFTRKKKGIGLGLALVKKLINVNNAEILVKSQPGDGTSFEIIFAAGGSNANNGD